MNLKYTACGQIYKCAKQNDLFRDIWRKSKPIFIIYV